MTMMQMTAVSIGRLGLAAAAFSRPARAPFYDLLVNAAIATGWLTERRTLHSRPLEKDAEIMVASKDVLVTGTILAGAASLVAKVLARRDPGASYLRKTTELNRSFARLGVASAPFINFALYDSYHPHPLRSFFSLW